MGRAPGSRLQAPGRKQATRRAGSTIAVTFAASVLALACSSTNDLPTMASGAGGAGGATASGGSCDHDPWQCAVGTTCWLSNDTSDTAAAFACLPSAAMAAAGSDCANTIGAATCGDGLACWEPPGGSGTCVPFCAADHPCPSGATCTPVTYVAGDPPSYSVCVPPGGGGGSGGSAGAPDTSGPDPAAGGFGGDGAGPFGSETMGGFGDAGAAGSDAGGSGGVAGAAGSGGST